ncbi:hypothetical protein [Burkholderia sp. IMCC1007]|uniref:hypothetical protein n=1 Tax=Burkholderia sp. IMCC1007 TaxID=3004104 RepID=UPI0022B401D5|nr:hypothetical protein [Burkholderia sp. IMCC1007]
MTSIVRSNRYRLPGAGTVSRAYRDKFAERISLGDFGLPTSGDVTASLMAFNAYGRANPNKRTELLLPAGTLSFTRPDWMQGIRWFKLIGANTVLYNSSTSGSTTQQIPLDINPGFNLDGTSQGVGGTFVPGYPIATLPRFSRIATLLTPSDSANFAIGSWVMIEGYNQGSSGFPASMRYFEFLRVKAVNIATGAITFDRATKYKYRQDWLDIQSNAPQAATGAARLVPLNRAGFNVCEYAGFENIVFGPSAGATDGVVNSLAGSLYTSGCLEVEIKACRINGYFYPTESDTVRVVDSHVEYSEVDKKVSHVLFDNCEIGQIDNGPACRKLSLLNGTRVRRPITTLGPRKFVSHDCEFLIGDVDANPRASQYINMGLSTAVETIDIERPTIDTIDPYEVLGQLPSQAGANSTQIVLPASASATDGTYLGYSVRIVRGTGAGQYRQISTAAGSYTGATRTAVVTNAWSTQPDATSIAKVERVLPFLAGGNQISVTVAAVDANANTIEVALTANGLNDPTIRGLDTGSLLSSTTTTTVIRVSDIYYNPATGNTVIAGEWSAGGVVGSATGVPTVGEVFAANIVRHVSLKRPRIRGTQPYYDNRSANSYGGALDLAGHILADDVSIETKYRKGNCLEIPFLFLQDVDGLLAYWTQIKGRPTRWVIDVVGAYTGTQPTATLTLSRPSAETTPVNPAPASIVINLKVAGTRVIDVAGVHGAQSGDTLGTGITPLSFWDQLVATVSAALGDAPPIGSIFIEFAP